MTDMTTPTETTQVCIRCELPETDEVHGQTWWGHTFRSRYEVFDASGELVASFDWDPDALAIAETLRKQGHVSAIRIA